MKMKKIVALMLVLCMITSLCACKKKNVLKELYTEDTSIDVGKTAKITMYYTDDAMTPFLEAAVKKYNETYPNIVINLMKIGIANYIESITQSNTATGSSVDLYMLSHSQLEKAYLAGIAAQNTNTALYNTDNYASTAIDSITYKGKMYGYPICYNTSFFVSNRMYVEDGVETFDALTHFAENFEPTAEMKDFQHVFEWNVSEMTSNYAFIGGVTSITGNTGDEKENINIYNTSTINALKEFQNLKDYFSIDRNSIETKKVIENFLSNKTVFAILNTDDLKAIVDSEIDYNISSIPSINTGDGAAEHLAAARALSTTELVMVNPFSSNQAVATSFAQFLTNEATDMLYEYAGKLSCKKSVVYEKAELNDLIKIYENSVPKTKLMSLSELYMYVEIMFHNIWDGEPVETELGKIKNYLDVQLR